MLNENRTRLVHAWENLKSGHKFLGVQRPETPRLAGPFTPAPAGLVAVFEDGHKVPVVFYDVHGRAVLLGEDEHRGLYLAEDDNDAVRIRMVGGEELGVLRDIERAAGQYFRDVGMSEIADDEPLPVEALAGYQCAASGVGCG